MKKFFYRLFLDFVVAALAVVWLLFFIVLVLGWFFAFRESFGDVLALFSGLLVGFLFTAPIVTSTAAACAEFYSKSITKGGF